MKKVAYQRDFLDRGVALPVARRGGTDYVRAQGGQLINMAIRQILNTDRYELPWNPEFGTNLRRQKNKLLNEDFKTYVVSELTRALTTFEPRIQVVQISVQVRDTTATVRVEWQVIDRNVPGNQVLVGPDAVEVSI